MMKYIFLFLLPFFACAEDMIRSFDVGSGYRGMISVTQSADGILVSFLLLDEKTLETVSMKVIGLKDGEIQRRIIIIKDQKSEQERSFIFEGNDVEPTSMIKRKNNELELEKFKIEAKKTIERESHE